MKQLIILNGVILLLITFPLQYVLEQKNHHNIVQLEAYVHNAKEKAKQSGYFTTEIIDELKNNILGQFKDLTHEDLQITVTTVPKYRKNYFDERELIYYKIEVPIRKIIAGNIFWGIKDINNHYTYQIENYTTSELIMP